MAIGRARTDDGPALRRIARDAEGHPIGFVTGHLRPGAPRTLFVWQVAVEGSQRGTGTAGALLDALSAQVAAECGVDRLEATVTPDNAPSDRMFHAYARRHGVALTQEALFPSTASPDEPDDTRRTDGAAPAPRSRRIVTATAALQAYWTDNALRDRTLGRAARVENALLGLCGEDGRTALRSSAPPAPSGRGSRRSTSTTGSSRRTR